MARPWPAPLSGTTLHVVGDLHFGKTQSGYAMATIRNNKVSADILASRVMPTVTARVHVGDFTDTAVAGQDTEANAWMNSMGGPWYGATGNHDIWGVRTAQAAVTAYTAWANRTTNWTADLGTVQLIGVGQSSHTPVAGDQNGVALDQAALDYVDAQLAAATKDCVVVCHAPLTDTVLANDEAAEYTTRAGGPDPNMQVSYEGGSTPPLGQIFNARSRAKVLLSGHTHSLIDAPRLLYVKSVGGRSVICLNASSPVYQGRLADPVAEPVFSFFLTFTGSNVEVRVRDHGARCWSGIGDTKVTTLALPA